MNSREPNAAPLSSLLGKFAIGLLALGVLLALSGMLLPETRLLMTSGIALILAMALGLFSSQLVDYRFTLWILIANLAAMLVPTWFISIGGFSLTDPWLLLLVIQMIMFGMGTQMSVRDFQHVVKMPWAVAIGLVCQFLIMPLVGYALALVFRFPSEIGAGMILIGTCSSGLASNVMTFLARGNLALSVTLTALATLAAPIMTPLWMRLLAGSMVDVDVVKMSLDIVKIVLVPILAAFVHDFLSSPRRAVRMTVWLCSAMGLGWLAWLFTGGWDWLLVQVPNPQEARTLSLLSLPGFIAGAFAWGALYHLATRLLPRLQRWMPVLSMFGIVYYTLVATAQGRDQLLAIGVLLLLAVTCHNLIGLALGYWASRAMGMSELDARTIAIEVGSQNGAMATGLAKSMGKLGTVGLAAVIFGPLMNVTGSILANYWRNRPPGRGVSVGSDRLA